jgi:hypothetical protein
MVAADGKPEGQGAWPERDRSLAVQAAVTPEDVEVVGLREVERRDVDVAVGVGGDALRMAGPRLRQRGEPLDLAVVAIVAVVVTGGG